MKSFAFNKRIILIIFLGLSFMRILNSPAYSSYINDLNYYLMKCYKLKTNKDCITSVKHLEAIQLDASNQNNYRCQTYALGLSSEIISMFLSSRRLKYPTEKVSKLDLICRDY